MYKITLNEMIKLCKGKKLATNILLLSGIMLIIAILMKSEAGLSKAYDFVELGIAQMTGFFFPLLGIIYVSSIFTDEASKGTLKIYLVHPFTRWEIFLGKFVSAFLSLLITIIGFHIISSLIGNLFFPINLGLKDFFDLLMVSIKISIPIFALVSILVIPAVSILSAGAISGMGIGVIVLMQVLSSFASYYSLSIEPYIIHGRFFEMISNTTQTKTIIEIFLISLVYVLASVAIAGYIFKKKDVTR